MESKPNITKIVIAALIVSAIIMLIVILAVSSNKQEEQPNIASESEFDNMRAKDIKVDYDKENNITKVEFTIENLSDESIKKQTINVMLLDENNVTISGIQNYIELIEKNSEWKGYAEILGDVSKTKKIQLEKPEVAE